MIKKLRTSKARRVSKLQRRIAIMRAISFFITIGRRVKLKEKQRRVERNLKRLRLLIKCIMGFQSFYKDIVIRKYRSYSNNTVLKTKRYTFGSEHNDTLMKKLSYLIQNNAIFKSIMVFNKLLRFVRRRKNKEPFGAKNREEVQQMRRNPKFQVGKKRESELFQIVKKKMDKKVEKE